MKRETIENALSLYTFPLKNGTKILVQTTIQMLSSNNY